MSFIKKGLNSFQLKIIALVIMTVDHLAAYRVLPVSGEVNVAMRVVGRAAAPLFLFLLAEGLRHTRSKIRYTLRLYIAGAALQAVNEVARVFLLGQGMGLQIGNIFQTLFYAALYITCIDQLHTPHSTLHTKTKSAAVMAAPFLLIFAHIYLPGFSAFLNVFLPSPFSVEYSFIFVLLGVVWYLANSKLTACAVLAVLSVFGALVDYRVFANPYGFTFEHMFYPIQWLMILALPFILLYNGEKGKVRLKYLFYAYYPAHQYLLFILGLYFSQRQIL